MHQLANPSLSFNPLDLTLGQAGIKHLLPVLTDHILVGMVCWSGFVEVDNCNELAILLVFTGSRKKTGPR